MIASTTTNCLLLLYSWVARDYVVSINNCIFEESNFLEYDLYIFFLDLGYASMTVPVYIAEVAPSRTRGQLVTMYQLMITLGLFVASISNGSFSYMEHDGWRYLFTFL